MRFYEKIEPIVAELIPLVQDLKYNLEDYMELEHNKACKKFQEHLKRYTEIIISLKNTNLIHQSYLPDNAFHAFNKLVVEMQDECEFWMDMAKYQVNNEYEKINNDKLGEKVDKVLILIAYAETLVKSRLREMCEE